MSYCEEIISTDKAHPIYVTGASYEEWLVDSLTVEQFAYWAGVELDDVTVVWRDDYTMEFHVPHPMFPQRESFVEGDVIY
ncbi:hypothetical protein [Spiribacter onubensis]|uniref:Uncharacterized protein n=1 Tax=Spiribacter onubensis TaxID=3122420 RepID=A0ABV3S6V4_9GAMM